MSNATAHNKLPFKLNSCAVSSFDMKFIDWSNFFNSSQAAWPQGRPDLEPVSADRCTPAVVEGQAQLGPMLAAAYKTGQVEVYR